MTLERSMNASEVREHWSEAVDAVRSDKTRIRIEQSGTPVAALVSARDLEWLALRDSQLEQLRAVVGQMRESFADVPEAEIEAEVARALAQVRGEHAPPTGTQP